MMLKKSLIVWLRKKKYTSRRKALYTGPLVIATNKFSASASEILAGAIQDYNRGIVVGEESTFGKGTVQQLVEVARLMPLFSDKSKAGYLKPTIQKYYRVTGNSTQQKGVEADIVLPAQHTILEYGERFLDNSLAFDTISPAKGFNPLDRSSLPIEALTRSSETRIATSIDFQYTQEDIDRQKEMISKNTISLNKATRLKLTDEGEARRHVRNEERRERFTTMQKADDKVFTFYRAWLNDLEKVELPLVDREHDSEENMRRADDKVGELNDTPEFPSGLDPIKREALEIISDFISINEDQVALLN